MRAGSNSAVGFSIVAENIQKDRKHSLFPGDNGYRFLDAAVTNTPTLRAQKKRRQRRRGNEKHFW
jgi:hypothetical protein